MIDAQGFRAGVAMVIVNKQRRLFWAKRIGQSAWQFPQGGLQEGETAEEAMYRELKEEVGLSPEDVRIVASTHSYLHYYLPEPLIRRYSKPVCIGQRQKWFLLSLSSDETCIHLGHTASPEFDDWVWVSYWRPMKGVVDFKKEVYRKALRIFAPYVFTSRG